MFSSMQAAHDDEGQEAWHSSIEVQLQRVLAPRTRAARAHWSVESTTPPLFGWSFLNYTQMEQSRARSWSMKVPAHDLDHDPSSDIFRPTAGAIGSILNSAPHLISRILEMPAASEQSCSASGRTGSDHAGRASPTSPTNLTRHPSIDTQARRLELLQRRSVG